MKLKAKFILPTLVLILAGMSVTSWIGYTRSTAALSTVAVDKAKTNLEALLSMVDLWVDGAKNELLTLALTHSMKAPLQQGTADSDVMARVMELLRACIERHPTFDAIMLIDPKGIVLASTSQALVGANLAEREYFQKAMQGQTFVSNPIISKDRGEAVFAIATPVKDGAKVLGILSMGIKIGGFSKQFVAPLDTPAGFGFICAPDGLALAHPDASLIGKFNVIKDTDYGAKIAGQDRGSLDVVSRGADRLILFEKSKSTGWIIGMAVNKDVAFADARSLGLTLLSLSFGQLVVLIVGIMAILSVNVLRPIDTLVAAASRIAGGDLDTRLDAGRKDEIGVLQQALATMVANLRTKIGEAEEKGRQAEKETQKATEAMAEAQAAREQAERAKQEGMLLAATRLEDIVVAVTAASEDIAGQIGQSSQGSEEQAHRVTETAAAMEQMNATVLEVAQNASQAADTADSARHKANEGSAVVARVVAGIENVQKKALALRDDMAELGRRAEGIGAVLGVISDIADQTNLLALNAAIEAARAGEAGRGFAVVADEVRKLAEKTMTATKEVGEAVTGIQQGARRNIENVGQAAAGIDEATSLASSSGEALAAIVSLVDATTDQVRAIATAAEEQSATTEEINRNIMDISRISSETAEALRHSSQALSGLTEQTRMLRELIDEMQAGDGGAKRLPAAGRRRALT
ncbi:MAG: methyl-accepting chemotaxis protein [Solidesulfovibrio sp. DCME]|uniref:methyl-accepting chemotaxis protein n=1 Tax=Solidesulfovibrio sp. DCME TaxID=3447380 RepID=UPI003D0ECFBE